MPSILAQDASVLSHDWGGPLNAWRARLTRPIGAPISADLDGALQALPVQIRALNGPWIKALQADPALPLPYTVGLGYQAGPILRSLSNLARPQVTHLGLRTEGELASLEGADLSAIRSLSFGDREDKAIKAPDLDLSGVDTLTLRGNCKSLKRLFKAYGWAPKIRALYLPTSVVKGSKFLIEAGGLPALESLHLRTWVNPKRLWAYVENQPKLRELHINNKLDMGFCTGCAALPWWRSLETLRIEGADMGPKHAMALLNADFDRLQTLQVTSWTTYGGLGKAPTAPPVLRALAKRRSPLPVERLFVGAPLGHGLEALADSRAFPQLKALYVKTQAFGTQPLPYTDSPLLPLQSVLDEPALWAQAPGHRPAFEALMSLVERGVRVYVDR